LQLFRAIVDSKTLHVGNAMKPRRRAVQKKKKKRRMESA